MTRVPRIDGGSFDVQRILCIGRNYRAHTLEMGGTERDLPFHFTKSLPSLLVANPVATLPYPPQTEQLEHEVELVVALSKGGRDIDRDRAIDHVCGYAIGLDMTRRDLQRAAKAKGRPWSAGKDFDGAAICGPLHTVAAPTGRIALRVGESLRQEAEITHLIWSISELIHVLSQSMTLVDGDLIYTGTPAGVGPVGRGDTMHASIDTLGAITVHVE